MLLPKRPSTSQEHKLQTGRLMQGADEMIRLAFALMLLALGFAAASPARADFTVIGFNSGYCRIWTDTALGPEDGHYLWFSSPSWGWHYRFLAFEGADAAMHQAVATHRCYHWW
jgi:hypothetical protein